MELVGDRALIRKLNSLPNKIGKKVARRAISKAARRLVKAAKQKAPTRTKQLKKSLGFRPRTYKSGVFAIVGPRKGFRIVDENGRPHDPAKIAHLVELGHGGPHAADAKPFLRPAFDETESSNMQLIADELRSGLDEEARKA